MTLILSRVNRDLRRSERIRQGEKIITIRYETFETFSSVLVFSSDPHCSYVFVPSAVFEIKSKGNLESLRSKIVFEF